MQVRIAFLKCTYGSKPSKMDLNFPRTVDTIWDKQTTPDATAPVLGPTQSPAIDKQLKNV